MEETSSENAQTEHVLHMIRWRVAVVINFKVGTGPSAKQHCYRLFSGVMMLNGNKAVSTKVLTRFGELELIAVDEPTDALRTPVEGKTS